MGVAHQGGRPSQPAVRSQGNDGAYGRSDDVGVGGDRLQPLWAHHTAVREIAAGGGDVGGEGGWLVGQLQQLEIGAAGNLAPQGLEVGDLEGLDLHRSGAGVGVGVQGGQGALLQRQVDAGEIGRVLQFGNDADDPATGGGLRGDEVDHLLQRRNLELTVIGRAARADGGQPLHRPQGLQLRQGEVLGEPPLDGLTIDGLADPPCGELPAPGHVGRAGDVVLMADHQHPVLGADQVRLHEVGAVLDGLGVGGEGVFGAKGAGAPVAEHQRPGPRWRGEGRRGKGGRGGQGGGRYEKETSIDGHPAVPMGPRSTTGDASATVS